MLVTLLMLRKFMLKAGNKGVVGLTLSWDSSDSRSAIDNMGGQQA